MNSVLKSRSDTVSYPFTESVDGMESLGNRVFYWKLGEASLSVLDGNARSTLTLPHTIEQSPFANPEGNIYVPADGKVLKLDVDQPAVVGEYTVTSATKGAGLGNGLVFLLDSSTGRFVAESGAVLSEFALNTLYDTEIVPFSGGVALCSETSDILTHGVLGDALEPSAIELLFADGTHLTLTAPEGFVYEELRPTVVECDGLLFVVSTLSSSGTGAGLVRYTIADRAVIETTLAPPLGWGWLARLATDTSGECTWYVQQPHVTKHLIRHDWETNSPELVMKDVSTHYIGSRNLRAGYGLCRDGQYQFLLQDGTYQNLHLIAGGARGWSMATTGKVATPLLPVESETAFYFGTTDNKLWRIELP